MCFYSFVKLSFQKPLLYHNEKPVPVERIAKIEEVRKSLEKLLSGHDFMAGDTLTVADYSFITLVGALEVTLDVKSSTLCIGGEISADALSDNSKQGSNQTYKSSFVV